MTTNKKQKRDMHVPNPIVRSAASRDFDDLLELYSELTGGLPVLSGDPGRAKLQEILRHEGTYVVGAEVSGKLVSVATLHICPNLTFGGRSYARVENVVTLSSHQGQGLSRMVMGHLIEIARMANVVSIVLLTGKGLEARGFYEKCGFSADEKWGMILKL